MSVHPHCPSLRLLNADLKKDANLQLVGDDNGTHAFRPGQEGSIIPPSLRILSRDAVSTESEDCVSETSADIQASISN